MASPASAKKQIIDSIKESSTILVTVSSSPSVDELSAALGLTLFLNKLDKHATAIASGNMPPAITFLEPDKTFESTADSLRDFIIALDKEKADHLRYKLEGDVVKIFITPYRTTITKNDLEFSQGDYNVELVLALNVASDKDLDTALSAHGKILHDATVATITAGDVKSSLGTIDWRDKGVSSVSEMAAEIIEGLKTPKASLDEQISTALLTGIVAATDRFSNELTSSRVMTIAAELMAAGANQQLIATKLEEAGDIVPEEPKEDNTRSSDGTTKLSEGKSTKITDEEAEEPAKKEEVAKDGAIGVMKIDHSREGSIDDIARQVMEESQEDAARVAEAKLNRRLAESEQTPQAEANPEPEQDTAAAPAPVTASVPEPDIMQDLEKATGEALSNQAEGLPSVEPSVAANSPNNMDVPTVGGTLNATTAQAAEDKRLEAASAQNRTILSHGSPLGSSEPVIGTAAPLNAAMAPAEDEPASVDVFAEPPQQAVDQSQLLADALNSADTVPETPPIGGTSSYQTVIHPLSEQAPALDYAQVASQDTNEQAMAPVPPAPAPEASFDGMPDTPPTFPAMPDFSNLPPLPPAPTGVDMNSLPPLPQADQPQVQPQQPDFNPNQFQIPPQQ